MVAVPIFSIFSIFSYFLRLSERLTSEFGPGFEETNLRKIRQFYLTYPIRDALRLELSWTHYRILMRIDNPNARSFYEIECMNNKWSSRELERQKGTFLFERLALSKDKKDLMKLARKGQELQKYEDMIKDPYVLEFTGLSADPKLYESKLEQALIDNLSKFLLEMGKGFTFVARQKRIFASRYKLYLPTEKELVRELKKFPSLPSRKFREARGIFRESEAKFNQN